jgi:hypothetical protein
MVENDDLFERLTSGHARRQFARKARDPSFAAECRSLQGSVSMSELSHESYAAVDGLVKKVISSAKPARTSKSTQRRSIENY